MKRVQECARDANAPDIRLTMQASVAENGDVGPHMLPENVTVHIDKGSISTAMTTTATMTDYA